MDSESSNWVTLHLFLGAIPIPLVKFLVLANLLIRIAQPAASHSPGAKQPQRALSTPPRLDIRQRFRDFVPGSRNARVHSSPA